MTDIDCRDCLTGNHATCQRNEGYPDPETGRRCGCHETGHQLDNGGAE